MEIAYLGLFQKIFNWVLNHIFDPVFEWLAKLLSTVLTWVFNSLLADILLPVLEKVLDYAFGILADIFGFLIYSLFSGILKIIDTMEIAFDVFLGIQPVTYYPSKGEQITGSLLEVLIQQKTVSNLFWWLTCSGLGIALILTIYSTAKSSIDLDFENKRPVSKVLAAMLKTFIQFFTVPFLVYFLLGLSARIMSGITELLQAESNTTLGRIVFVMTSLNAATAEKYNIPTQTILAEGDIRNAFYYTNISDAKDYGDINAVAELFYLADFDYLVGFIIAVFLFFVLGICVIVFVQRLFELILLYIVSPYFVSTIPLDDGEKFGRWREMFVAKCFSGFGSAMGMRLYLMICPLIMTGKISFGSSSPEMDYMMRLFFLAGGAWAVYKAGPMITQLLNVQAGQAEGSTLTMAGGAMYAQTTGKVVGAGKQIGTKLLERVKNGKQNENQNQSAQLAKLASAMKYNGTSGTSAYSRSPMQNSYGVSYNNMDRGMFGGTSGGDGSGDGRMSMVFQAIQSIRLQKSGDNQGKNDPKQAMSGQNTMKQIKTVVEVTRTIRTEVVQVRSSGSNEKPSYSKYSKMANASRKSGTGGYK